MKHTQPNANVSLFDLPTNPFGLPQMMKIKDVARVTCLSESSIYDIMDKKSKRYDPTFPRQIKLTERSVVWRADQIGAWLESKIKASMA